jgi:hypothetical protein
MTCRDKDITVTIGQHKIRTYVLYHVIPGEKAALNNPPSLLDLEIKKIRAMDFETSSIGPNWLNEHPDWTAWLESVLEDIIIDYNNPYITELIDGYNFLD